MNRLQEKYQNEVRKALTEKFGYKNVMEIPKLVKVVVNVTTKDAVGNAKVLESISADLSTITGQKPLITRAKKSIATWKLRKGMQIGCKVTLRAA